MQSERANTVESMDEDSLDGLERVMFLVE